MTVEERGQKRSHYRQGGEGETFNGDFRRGRAVKTGFMPWVRDLTLKGFELG